MSVLRQVLETSVASLKENQVLLRATSLAMLQLCNIARNILREVVFCNLSHSGTRKMIYHINRFSLSWAFCTCNLFSGLFWSFQPKQPKYLRHCNVFWLKWPVHDLVLVIHPPLLIIVASNTRSCSKLGGTTLNGGEEGGQYYGISQTCDYHRFEARKVFFLSDCLDILQLVEASC